jgi:hypothetical protein
MQEVDNIIRIIEEALSSIEQRDYNRIKNLSNQTIHSATIYQDPDNIIVAVFIYAIGKIFEREHYRDMEGWKEFENGIIKNLKSSLEALKKSDISGFRNSIGRIRSSVNKISGNLRMYISDVFQKAGINKAFRMYEHGLSDQQTAELLGISLWDLATYIGQSGVHETKLNMGISQKERIKITEQIFK